jgi:hypothetical protein
VEASSNAVEYRKWPGGTICFKNPENRVCENVPDAVAGSSFLFLSLHEEGFGSTFVSVGYRMFLSCVNLVTLKIF